MKPHPSDADRWKPGLVICDVFSPCDPPTLDLARVFDLAFDKGFKMAFLCPLYVNEDQARRAVICSEIFCGEYYSATGRQVGCCTVLIDKKMKTPSEYMEWANQKMPYAKARSCMLASQVGDLDADIVVAFRGQEAVSAKELWVVSRHPQSPADMANRIRSGSDESRWFQHGLWNFLMENSLYTNR